MTDVPILRGVRLAVGILARDGRLRFALPLGQCLDELRRDVVERDALRSGRPASFGRTMMTTSDVDAALHDFFQRGLLGFVQALRRTLAFAIGCRQAGGRWPRNRRDRIARFLAADERSARRRTDRGFGCRSAHRRFRVDVLQIQAVQFVVDRFERRIQAFVAFVVGREANADQLSLR